MKKIGIIVGSLRKDSYNKTAAEYIGQQLKDRYAIQFIEIGNLPLYNPDLDEETTLPQWSEFRTIIDQTDAFLFATPEYNRSFPASIKNALDVASRPYGSTFWDNKPCAVISASMGPMGGFGANNHLRQTLTFLNLITMPQPEVYLSTFQNYIDEQGHIHAKTKDFLNEFAQSFDQWIQRMSK